MFNKFIADECLKAVEGLDSAISDNVPDTIYHYTKAESFRGIIESREIWMTNAFFVNDKMELRHWSNCNDLFEGVEFNNPEFKKLKNECNVEDYYLACFSKDGNSLSQFCAYGDYCIGFESQKLKKNLFQLFECVYAPEAIKEWVVKKDKLEEWRNKCFDNDQGKVYKRVAFYGVEYAARAKLKNKHYESEEEIRLLVVSNSSWDGYTSTMFTGQPAIYFKNSNTLNVPEPYVKFFIPKKSHKIEELNEMVDGKSTIESKQIIRNIEKEQGRELLPISKVIIGPMRHQEEAVVATKIFLREKGYDKVKVEGSDIPFRGN
ncbi:MAG: hypothetical protein A2Y13_09035 [Planctomycetes bacterium GWC2_45_44]|nr:MAG: hypothetical protein A2Y13_09035 [Planctomycetes bacterium GWC2_45_44]HBR19348.1 hypothetical protein [Phycisphaerales bacterium]